MGLKFQVLAKAIDDYLSRSPRGSQAALSRKSGVSASTIKRIAAGDLTPTIGSWEKLHGAAPEILPPVTFDKEPAESGTPNAVKIQRQITALGRDEVENDLIRRMLKVVRSRTPYAPALRENIIAFSEAVDDFNAVRGIRPQDAPGETKK